MMIDTTIVVKTVKSIEDQLATRIDDLQRDGDINSNAATCLGGIVEWLGTYAWELNRMTEDENNQPG